MKKNALTTALVAGLAGIAGLASVSNAVNINPDGLGQVLVYPYYTVNAGNQTQLSVVNTTNTAKAVKVRFLEGKNSREVLDFNLYMSEFDVWTAALFSLDDSGPGYIVTLDRSCTVPAIFNATDPSAVSINIDGAQVTAIPFRNFAYGNFGPGNNFSDGESQSLFRTREGHFEMIEMATVVGGSRAALRHGANGIPANCGTLINAWGTNGYWQVNPAVDTLPPAGGLFGAASIIDPANGTQLPFNADAIDRFSVSNLHQDPGNVLPSLASANTGGSTVQSIVFDNGFAVTSNWQTGAEAVSAVYLHDKVVNEYVIKGPGLADSEWVVTFPTKRFYVDPAFAIATTPVRPFTRSFTTGGACEPLVLAVYDREERVPASGAGPIFSPRPPGVAGPVICWEAQVISFNNVGDTISDTSNILGSSNRFNLALPAGFLQGWGSLTFAAASITRPSAEGHVYSGLPVTGFWAITQTNTNAQPGLLAQYGGLAKHRATRSICLSNC